MSRSSPPLWICPIGRTSRETVPYGLRASRVQLENGSEVSGAAAACGAVEITRRILYQTCVGTGSVCGSSSEAVQHCLGAIRSHFEYGSQVRCSAGGGRTVEIARRVLHQICIGVCSVRRAGAVGITVYNVLIAKDMAEREGFPAALILKVPRYWPRKFTHQNGMF